MPLTSKGRKIKSSMESQYGKKKGEQVFYASKNKGTIGGVEGHGGMKRNRHGATVFEDVDLGMGSSVADEVRHTTKINQSGYRENTS